MKRAPAMACDSGPQEPPLSVLLGAAAATRLGGAAAMLRRRALQADEEGHADAVAEQGHALARTADECPAPPSVLLLPSGAAGSFFRHESLGRLCKVSSAASSTLDQEISTRLLRLAASRVHGPVECASLQLTQTPRAQVSLPIDNSAGHLVVSHLQDRLPDGAVVLLGVAAAAATRHAPAQLGGRALADEEEQGDEGSSEETTGPDTVLLLSSSSAAVAKEALARLCKTSSTQEPRVQVVSSMDNSAVDLLSYLQLRYPKAVMLLAEKTGEIWEVPSEDSMEECVTGLAMLLLVVEEKTSAPVSMVIEGISTKRSCYHVRIMLQFSGSSRTVLLLLKNMGTISVGCLPFSVDSEYFTEFFSADFGLVEKAVLIGLKRGSQIQLRSFGFAEFEGEEGVVNARYQMLGKRMAVKDAVYRPYLPAELQKKVNHTMLDGELCEEHSIPKSCPLPVQCLPSWFLMSRKWLPVFLVGEAEKLKERYPLNDLEGDSRATYIVELCHGVHGYDKPRHLMHFLPGVHRICVVPGRNGTATNSTQYQTISTQHQPLLSQSQPKSELAESKSDYQYPISPLTSNITGDSHETEIQQLDQCSESNNVETHQGNEYRLTNADSRQVGDSADKDSLVIPIFVRHVSGELTFTVSLDQSSQHLMHLYAQKTKRKLDRQSFVYQRKTLEPDHTLLFYGLQRDTTVHVCTGLLGGGSTTLQQYVDGNKNTFTVEVTLPDGKISLQMTTKGCQFLSSWMKCFTTAFAKGQSWNGEFTLEDFKFEDGHVQKILKPKKYPAGSMGNDLSAFVVHVERILCNPYLISKYPPYLEHFINTLKDLVTPLSFSNLLTSDDKLFLETHVCCMTCFARERLIIELFRKYEGLDRNEADDWEKAISAGICILPWDSELSTKSSFFQSFIERGKTKGITYDNKSKTSAFVFIKDTVLHATDHRTKDPNVPQLGDGIELMIPAHLGNFLPSIILKLIKKNVDISAELLAAISCACNICDSSH